MEDPVSETRGQRIVYIVSFSAAMFVVVGLFIALMVAVALSAGK